MSDHERVLTSVKNPHVVELAKLHDVRKRRAVGRTLVEGPHHVADVLEHGAEVHEIFHVEDDHGSADVAARRSIPATAVSHTVLRKLAGTEHPRGPVAVVSIPDAGQLEAVDTVVLWEIRDPGNAGAIIRTAAALGYAVAATPGTVDLWSPKVLRAAAATQFRCPMAVLPDASVAALAWAGLHVVATVARGGEDPAHVAIGGSVALLVGNEAHGLPEDVESVADSRVTIPLERGVESLNAAVAAAIVMYALRRR